MSRIPVSKPALLAFACPEWAKLPSPAGPVPVPYPDASSIAASTSSASKVNVLQAHGLSKAGATSAVEGKTVTGSVDKAVLRGMKSQIPMSTGDEAGASGGGASGTQAKSMGMAKPFGSPKPSSSKVFLGNSNAGAANGPAMGSVASPSQAMIMVAP